MLGGGAGVAAKGYQHREVIQSLDAVARVHAAM